MYKSLLSELRTSREITWRHEKFPLTQVQESVFKEMCTFSSTALVGDCCVRVIYEDTLLSHPLRLKYRSTLAADSRCITVYFKSPENTSDLAQGYYVQDSNTFYIEGSGFGLLKSIINAVTGLQFLTRKEYPLHAAALQVDGCGIAIVGGHGYGKTSLAIDIASIALSRGQEVRFLADDWISVRLSKHGRLIARSPDPTISLTEVELDRIPTNLRSMNLPHISTMQSIKKLSLRPHEVILGALSADTIDIDTVLVLSPEEKKPALERLRCSRAFARYAVSASYHFPFTSYPSLSDCYRFWRRFGATGSTWIASHASEDERVARAHEILRSINGTT